jgi:DNA-binding LytR/AlgR family response regulator
MNDGRKIMSKMTLKSLQEKLPKSSFMKVHRSFIINLDFITSTKNKTILINSDIIPISDPYLKDISNWLKK